MVAYTETFQINFRNQLQVMLWESELAGQISDGMWENSRPMDHYIAWGHARATVDATKPGRNFRAVRDNYNFTNPDLLDAVGDRMLFRAKLLILHPEIVDTISSYDNMPMSTGDLVDYRRYASHEDSASDYWHGRLAEWDEAGVTQEVLDEVQAWNGYTMKELRKELNDMKAIIRLRF